MWIISDSVLVSLAVLCATLYCLTLSLFLVYADAEFVASVLVRESVRSPVGDDDKIYYFFTERAGEETTSVFDKTQAPRVARVARVCKVKRLGCCKVSKVLTSTAG